MASVGATDSPLNATVESAGAVSRNTSRLSFKTTDEFFHAMLSYRVRTEGPLDKGGNDLARLIYEVCCATDCNGCETSAAHISDSLQHFSNTLECFGKWPKAFSGQSKPIRIFLDQVNLRMGVPWKGTGNADSGGFLGAVSQALLMVPLFSANPALFKVVRVGSSEMYALESPVNMKIANGTEILSVHINEDTGKQTIRGHICDNIQPDGSFRLSASPEDVAAHFPSKYQFYSTTNFLPSDGSGPRGSLADLLTIRQRPEEFTFRVISASEGIVVLQAEKLSDHIFFSNELISINVLLMRSSFKIVQVICQGSIVGGLFSKIKVDVGDQMAGFSAGTSAISGATQDIDRCDNVLMELMLCRALRTITASRNLHPCKLIMPVFVDDMDILYPLSDRLSETNSKKTAVAVKSALEAIVQRKLTLSEEEQWIHSSVKSVVKFYFDFQGLQLGDKASRYKDIKAKAWLVQHHIVTTVGIEANNNALFQYCSNNPLAQELLNFLDKAGLLHLHPVLVKHDITCVKEFSLLSPSAIEKIAHDGHELSSRPLIKETVDISRAISSAQSSMLILPVSKRLELFEDVEASFLTVIYSSYAIYLALQKPFFSLIIQTIFGSIVFGVGVYQLYDDPVRNLPFILPNFARVLWMVFAMTFVFVFNSLKAAFRAWIFWSFITGLGFVLGFILDKVVNGQFEWGHSKDCAASISPQLFPAKYASCVSYYYPYFGFNAVFYWAMTYCISFRQHVVWRCLTVGITVQIVMATYIEYSTAGTMTTTITMYILGCFFVPLCLVITETLRFYGTLQALQITKKDSITNAKHWELVLANSREDIERIAQMLNHSFDYTILDRSPDLGSYRSTTRAAKIPAPIRQPIRDFDELYDVASVVNNTFQTWVESFFGSDVPSANFLYLDERYSVDHLHQHLRFKSFHGIVSRGPVKLPERAIAKVYRTYRGDVSLITDIVRCAVQFETAADMRLFVSEWIMKYGKARFNTTKAGLLTTIRNESREFVRIFGEYLRRTTSGSEAVDAEADDVMPASICDEDFKLFEICRIRNRMDPELIDVPGGYRDLAFKLKVGFVRLPDSGSVRILPVSSWSTSNPRPKFIIVEMQLLLQIMRSDEQMHRNYATMRDKMTN